MKWLLNTASLLLLCYLAFGVLLFIKQRSFLYFPTPPVPHAFEDVRFESEGETLNLVLVNGVARHAVLYFGGNAEAVAHNGPAFAEAFPDHASYLVNYRGYGGSTGVPSEAALFADALNLYDQLAPLYESLTVIGRSLGSGVAAHLAAERPVQRLVLITPFDSIENVARARFPIYPLSVMLKDPFDSASRAEAIAAEVMVLIAGRDEIIPRARTDALVAAFGTRAPRVVVFDQADHNGIAFDDNYYPALSAFVARAQ